MGPGAWITPNVRLERPLGGGGMGSVWIAEHTTLHTHVVVKLMRPELAQDPDVLARFSREAAAAANVKSPHVVQVFDHGVTPTGEPFIVMELLEGEDLAARLTRGAMAHDEASAIMSQIGKALSRAHERGIVHRDIKPNNIFLCHVGGGETFVKVLDFGIAKAGGEIGGGLSATSTGALMGTPYYMSPEQALGHKTLDYRTDIWAAGVVGYEMLTGRKPFLGETVGALAIAICHAPLPQPSAVNPALPATVDAWFARACARDPAHRFASTRELAESFATAMSGPVSLGLAKTIPSVPPAALPAIPALSSTTTAPTSRGGDGSTRNAPIVALLVAISVAGVFATAAGLFIWRAKTRASVVVHESPPIVTAQTSAPTPTLGIVALPLSAVTSPSALPPLLPTHTPGVAHPPASHPQVAPHPPSSFDRNSID